ncbi:MAG: PAS domain S-box protein [Desulfobacteraceae bacterium]|jgi:PAS domain S-box-containing protein
MSKDTTTTYIGQDIPRPGSTGTKATPCEKVLRENEYKYNMIIDKMLNGFALHEIICDERGKPVNYRFLNVNPAFEKITKYKARDLLGKTVLEIRPQTDPFLIEIYGKVALTGKPIIFDFHNKYTDEYFVITAFQPAKGQFACIFQNITELKKTENALRESEHKFRIIAENPVSGIFIIQNTEFIYVNDRMAEMYGYSKEEIIGQSYLILAHPDERKTIKERIQERLMAPEKYPRQRFDILWIKKNRKAFWGAVIVAKAKHNGKDCIIGSVVDISGVKQAEQDLKKAHDELEQRVQERTEELEKANEILLEKTNKLEDVNTTLRVLLEKRNKDKEEDGEKILLNVKELLIPNIQKLKVGPLTENQKNHIALLESGLDEIVSPFVQELTSKYLHVTPRELQVAFLVKEGKTSKEIANILCTAESTVVFHRANLRKKLKLKKKSNLRTYLMSLRSETPSYI